MIDKKLILKIHRLFKKTTNNYQGLYLYGSRVNNKDTSDSDYDMIFLNSDRLSNSEKQKIYTLISKIEYDNDVFIDIQFLTPAELAMNPFFHKEVTEKGLFYAA